MSHPYSSAPTRAFWSRSVARDFDTTAVPDGAPFTIGADDRFVSAGSCFASNVRRYLEAAGYHYVVTEGPHPMWPESVENPNYEAFSARYGNIYTARQMVQLLARATGEFAPVEEYWQEGSTYIDPFRPGLVHRASSVGEYRALTAAHLGAVVAAFEAASVFVFTLGLTEAWLSGDGAVFPACPGTVSGSFDPTRHNYHNFNVEEVTADVLDMIDRVRAVNPSLKIILTVSPVPLVATASGRHVLTATTYSKSVLRVAADQAAHSRDDVSYFPAYEIVTGPQHHGNAFEADLRNVREEVIAQVMDAFFACYAGAPSHSAPSAVASFARREPIERSASLSDALAVSMQADCDEMMMDEELIARG